MTIFYHFFKNKSIADEMNQRFLCKFINHVLHNRKNRKNLFRRVPDIQETSYNNAGRQLAVLLKLEKCRRQEVFYQSLLKPQLLCYCIHGEYSDTCLLFLTLAQASYIRFLFF